MTSDTADRQNLLGMERDMMRVLRSRSGFTLVEVALCMAILSLLASAVVPVAIRQVELELAQRTGREVSLIQEGAKWFYVDQKRWPNSITEMQSGGYLNASWNRLSPFGVEYAISQTPSAFAVSVPVPAGVEGAVQQLVITPSATPEGTNVRVTSTTPVPGRESSLNMFVHKEGDTMTGPLRLDNTAIIWQRGNTPHWTTQLDGSNNLQTRDGDGATRLQVMRSGGNVNIPTSVNTGSASISGLLSAGAVSANSGTFSSLNAGSGTVSSLSASQASISSLSAGSASFSSLSGGSANFSGNVSANDYFIRAVNHFASEANF